MARTSDQEEQAIEEEARLLAERREKLAKRRREEAIRMVERAGLLRLDGRRLDELTERIRRLGIDEVEKRLAA